VAGSVRSFLREFLSDWRVLDIPFSFRWLLLTFVILPFRPRKSAQAYASIWDEGESPLSLHTRNFTDKLRTSLPVNFKVDYAMRYGNPDITSRLDTLLADSPDELLIFPQYPHYASATTGSSLEAVFKALASRWNIPAVTTVAPFYRDPGFLSACAERGRPLLASVNPDHVIFSFHGLPERQIRKSAGGNGNCLRTDDSCCKAMTPANSFCYRAQCFETARGIAAILNLREGDYSVTFQSRLGRTPWIGPATEAKIGDLASLGKKRVLVFCPSFTADCLETLEEIAIRAEEQFKSHGGDSLTLVPSLNDSEAWVGAARNMILATRKGGAGPR
jgi:protoporphyrin/coproporphyrin ferrochelatase